MCHLCHFYDYHFYDYGSMSYNIIPSQCTVTLLVHRDSHHSSSFSLWWCVSFIHANRYGKGTLLHKTVLCFIIYHRHLHSNTLSFKCWVILQRDSTWQLPFMCLYVYVPTHPNKLFSHVVDAQFLCPENDFIFIVLAGDTLTSANTALQIACVSRLQ